MKRGAVFWVDFKGAFPPELGKTRPAMVLSNTEQNAVLESIVLVPFSSRAPAIWPLRLAVNVPSLRQSYAVIAGVRQASKKRLLKQICILPDEIVREIYAAMTAYLGE